MQVLNRKFESFLFLKGLQPVTVFGHLSGINRILRKVDSEHFDDFVIDLYKSGYSYSHKANSVKTVEYYLEFLGRPKRYNRQRKPRPLLKETLSESEINCLMLSCKNIREKAILSLLAYSGVRPKELCRVRVSDLNIGNKTLFVNLGKGMKDGIVEISSRCIEIILQYLANHPRQSDDFLFQTLSGKQYNQGALRKLIKVLAKRAGLEKRIYPYLYRHSFAVNMVLRDAPILYIKQQLRHSFLDTTMIYLNSTITRDSRERFLPQYC
jgi:integrase